MRGARCSSGGRRQHLALGLIYTERVNLSLGKKLETRGARTSARHVSGIEVGNSIRGGERAGEHSWGGRPGEPVAREGDDREAQRWWYGAPVPAGGRTTVRGFDWDLLLPRTRERGGHVGNRQQFLV